MILFFFPSDEIDTRYSFSPLWFSYETRCATIFDTFFLFFLFLYIILTIFILFDETRTHVAHSWPSLLFCPQKMIFIIICVLISAVILVAIIIGCLP